MKSVFPYLVMIALFLAGTRLVNRQQEYIRSKQELAVVETASSGSILAKNKSKMQALQSTTNITKSLIIVGLMKSKKRVQ